MAMIRALSETFRVLHKLELSKVKQQKTSDLEQSDECAASTCHLLQTQTQQ